LPPAVPGGSTSTRGTGSKTPAPTAAATIAVRRRAPALRAVRLTAPRPVTRVDGTLVDGQTGDYLITRGAAIVDCLAPALFADRYEIVQEGELVVPVEIRRRIEATTGIGSTLTPADLVAAIERLASIAIGAVKVEFSPGQLEEIAHRAAKRGRSVEAELNAAVDRIKDEIFHRG
jgi:hypothetical protein